MADIIKPIYPISLPGFGVFTVAGFWGNLLIFSIFWGFLKVLMYGYWLEDNISLLGSCLERIKEVQGLWEF